MVGIAKAKAVRSTATAKENKSFKEACDKNDDAEEYLAFESQSGSGDDSGPIRATHSSAGGDNDQEVGEAPKPVTSPKAKSKTKGTADVEAKCESESENESEGNKKVSASECLDRKKVKESGASQEPERNG
jgi:hypothetical protein